MRGFLNWLVHGAASEPDAASPTRREQLLEAQARIQHQIAILETGPAYIRTPDSVGAFCGQAGELKRVLDEIDQSLAELEPDEG